MKIDFTTTAMPRPDILNRCYKSFQKNLIGIDLKECDLYINVDPLPSNMPRQTIYIKKLIDSTIEVAATCFKKVVARTPKEANYASAYKWLWGEAKSDIIFNLEDDWELLKPVNVSHMLRKFDICQSLYQVVFRAYTYVYPTCCTSPSFLHRRWYYPISQGMNTKENPESQIHKNNNGKFKVFVPNRKTCDWKKYPGEKRVIENYITPYPKYRNVKGNIIVRDIGKKWIENSPYCSPVTLLKEEMWNFKRYKHRLDAMQIRLAKRHLESLKKVNFLSWVIKKDVNPLKWLMEYK